MPAIPMISQKHPSTFSFNSIYFNRSDLILDGIALSQACYYGASEANRRCPQERGFHYPAGRKFVGVGTLGSGGQRVGSSRRNTCPNFSNTLDVALRS